MTYTCVQKQYCVALTIEEWAAMTILNCEDRGLDVDAHLHPYIVTGSIECNGHFGQNLWFSVGEENFGDVVKIVKMLRKFLSEVVSTQD